MGGLLLVTSAAVTAPLFVPSAFAKGPYVANTAGPPTADGIQPVYHAGNITSCPSGTTTIINTSGTGPGNQSVSYSSGGSYFNAIVYNNGETLKFTTNLTNYVVYVKGGPAYDTYDYSGTAITADDLLHMPVNNGGNISTISHYLVCGNPAPQGPQYSLYAGYADSFRGQLPYYPSPWQGDANVTFVGCGYGGTDNCPTSGATDLYDSGALRIDNTGTIPLSVTGASVTIGTCTFNPWGSLNVSVPVGGTLILTQTGGSPECNAGDVVGNYNFDSSESTPSGDTNICTANDGLVPAISLTINGTTTVHNDSAQVLNDQGTDPGDPSCTGGHDEFQNWTLIS